MSKPRHSTVVIFDLEFTAWEGSVAGNWSRPGERREVVQIGAVKLGAQDLKSLDHFDVLLRPRFNCLLSSYLTELTGITNEALSERAMDFVPAYRSFLEFVGDAPIWAFGRDDLVLIENINLYGWDRHLKVPPYSNVIPWFAEQGIELKGEHASDVAEAAGTKFEGRKHDALADARSVAAGIVKCVHDGAPNPFLTKNSRPSRSLKRAPKQQDNSIS